MAKNKRAFTVYGMGDRIWNVRDICLNGRILYRCSVVSDLSNVAFSVPVIICKSFFVRRLKVNLHLCSVECLLQNNKQLNIQRPKSKG